MAFSRAQTLEKKEGGAIMPTLDRALVGDYDAIFVFLCMVGANWFVEGEQGKPGPLDNTVLIKVPKQPTEDELGTIVEQANKKHAWAAYIGVVWGELGAGGS